jgi:hypothetical protein
MGSFFSLLVLLPYNSWSDGAYYHMQGYGIQQTLHGILLFTAGFLFLGAKKHRWWSYLYLGMSLFLIAFLVERGTQTVFIALCAFIVLRETYQIKLKYQLILFLGLPTFMITSKFMAIYFSNPSGFIYNLVVFFTYELGRMDFLVAAVYSKLQGFETNPMTLLRYIPFANYLPVIKDLNEIFQAAPEKFLLGSRVSVQGGLPFTSTGEMAILVGTLGSILIYSIWGLIFGSLYAIVRANKNPYLLGFYALFLYSAKGLALTGLGTIVCTIIFLTIFCEVKEPRQGNIQT